MLDYSCQPQEGYLCLVSAAAVSYSIGRGRLLVQAGIMGSSRTSGKLLHQHFIAYGCHPKNLHQAIIFPETPWNWYPCPRMVIFLRRHQFSYSTVSIQDRTLLSNTTKKEFAGSSFSSFLSLGWISFYCVWEEWWEGSHHSLPSSCAWNTGRQQHYTHKC